MAHGRDPPTGVGEYEYWQRMYPLEHASPAPNPFGLPNAATDMEFEDTGMRGLHAHEALLTGRPLPIGAPFEYDCVVVVIGHSSVYLDRRNFRTVPSDFTIKTIQVANIDGVVYGDSLDLRRIVHDIFTKPGMLGATPEVILGAYLAAAKQYTIHHDIRAELDTDLRYRDFLVNNGNASTNYNEYYNKTFNFSHWGSENGSVILIDRARRTLDHLFKDVIDDSIRKEQQGLPTNKLTKEQILAEVYRLGFRHPLFLDVGCAGIKLAGKEKKESDMSLDEYVARGALGGKSKRKKYKKKKSYRSKKTIRITQR